jgi:secreted Zn-dependent insulinase-like peptidase
MNVLQQSNDNWTAICDENFEFNSKERLIESLKNVTLEMVQDKFDELFIKN